MSLSRGGGREDLSSYKMNHQLNTSFRDVARCGRDYLIKTANSKVTLARSRMSALNRNLPTTLTTSLSLCASLDILYMCTYYKCICTRMYIYMHRLSVVARVRHNDLEKRSNWRLYLWATVEISETKARDSRRNALFLVERSVPERPYQALRVPARMRKPCPTTLVASFNVLAAAIVRRISPRIRAVSHDPELKRKRRVRLTRTAVGTNLEIRELDKDAH